MHELLQIKNHKGINNHNNLIWLLEHYQIYNILVNDITTLQATNFQIPVTLSFYYFII